MSQLKEIVFVTKWFPNRRDHTDGDFIQHQAKYLSEKITVHVFYIGPGLDNQAKNIEIETNLEQNCSETLIYYKPSKNPFKKLWIILKANKIAINRILGIQPKLIQLNILQRIDLVSIYLKLKHEIPYIISEHWSGYYKADGSYKGFFRKIWTKFIVKHSKAVLVVSKGLKNAMESHNLKGNYKVIPNVVSEPKNYQIVSKKNQIITTCIIEERTKQLKLMIDSFHLFQQNNIDYQLIIAGKGEDEQMIKSYVKSLNLEEKVIFTGFLSLDKIHQYLQESKIYINTSAFETFSISTAEALMNGIPAVVVKNGGPEQFIEETNGKVVPPNKESISIALQTVIDNYENYNSAQIREKTIHKFSKNTVVQQILDCYDEIMKLN